MPFETSEKSELGTSIQNGGILLIGPMKEWRKGWAVQTVHMPARDADGNESQHKRCTQTGRSMIRMNRGYVKLWRLVDGDWIVVDRALTQKRAKAMARSILAREAAQQKPFPLDSDGAKRGSEVGEQR